MRLPLDIIANCSRRIDVFSKWAVSCAFGSLNTIILKHINEDVQIEDKEVIMEKIESTLSFYLPSIESARDLQLTLEFIRC